MQRETTYRDYLLSGNLYAKGWSKEDAIVSDHDKRILQELGKRLRVLAERPEEYKKAKLWAAHNDLRTDQPVVFIDCENGWGEILPWEKTIKCEGSMAQAWEMWIRKEICWAEELKDDKVIEAKLYLPYTALDTEWGVDVELVGNYEDGGAYTWKAPLEDMDEDAFEELDVEEFIKIPQIIVDYEASEMVRQCAEDVFDGILTIERRHSWWWGAELTHSYVNMRGLQNMMTDFYDFPEKVHEMMRRFTDGYLAKFDYLEKNGLLTSNTGSMYIGSGGIGYTNQLVDTAPEAAMLKNMWGFNESQETSTVSPEMVNEYVLPYQHEIAEKFGLNYYGCCEGLDTRWEYVKNAIPRLRRVSVSPWADKRVMSEYLSNQYVYCLKVPPMDIAVEKMDEARIGKELRETLQYCKECGNIVEILMKDNHTLAKKRENAIKWVQIAREEIARVYA